MPKYGDYYTIPLCVREVVSQIYDSIRAVIQNKENGGEGGKEEIERRGRKKKAIGAIVALGLLPLAPLSLLHPCLLVLQTLPAQTNCMPSWGWRGRGEDSLLQR